MQPQDFENHLKAQVDFPSPSRVAEEIIALARDPDIEMATVAQAVGRDPAMTAKILRIANSAFYAQRRPSQNLRQALVIIGLNAALTLALSFSLVSSMRALRATGIDYPRFWRRSLLSATAARAFGESARSGMPRTSSWPPFSRTWRSSHSTACPGTSTALCASPPHMPTGSMPERAAVVQALAQRAHSLLGMSHEKFNEVVSRILSLIPETEALYETSILDAEDADNLLDLDRFKLINEKYGSAVGDKVLQSCAQVMQACVRGSDLVARFSGEEFVVVLPGADREIARQVAQRVLTALSSTAHDAESGGVRVTASIGIATYTTKQRFPSTLALLEAADHALYAAKLCGRNRVESFEELSASGRNPVAARG
jgi:diguanylate cyclase (GGDEF)-like protein